MKTQKYIITLSCENENEEFIPSADEVQTALENSSLIDKTIDVKVDDIQY